MLAYDIIRAVLTQNQRRINAMPKIIDDEQVFSEVIKVIVAKGYENATTKELAEAAGVNEVTLFYTRILSSRYRVCAKVVPIVFIRSLAPGIRRRRFEGRS
jgi:hypothetical protein